MSKRSHLSILRALSASLSLALAFSGSFNTSSAIAASQDLSGSLKEIAEHAESGRTTEEDFKTLNDYVSAHPSDSRGHYVLGLFLQSRGYEQLALESLEKAISIAPDFFDAHFRLMVLYLKLKDDSAAAKELALCKTLAAGNGLRLFRLGVAMERFGSKDEASTFYEQAFKAGGSAFGLGSSLASMRISQGRYREALTALENDLKIDPKDARANLLKAEALKKLGEDTQAMDAYKVAYNTSPCDGRAAYQLARRLAAGGDYAEALHPALTSICCSARDPETLEDTKRLVVSILSNLPSGKTSPVVAELGLELNRSPGDAQFFHLVMGDIYDRIGQIRSAVDQYELGIKYASRDRISLLSRGLYRLGRDQELYLRDYDRALNNYAQAHVLNPQDQEILAAYNRLRQRLSKKNKDFALWLKDSLWSLGKSVPH